MWRKAEGTSVATQGVSLTHWLSNLTSFLCLVDPVCLAGSVLDEPASLSLPMEETMLERAKEIAYTKVERGHKTAELW